MTRVAVETPTHEQTNRQTRYYGVILVGGNMIHRQEALIGGRVMSIETGRVAEQASGAALVRYGDTVILATVVGSDVPREGIDFFPLTVEKYT